MVVGGGLAFYLKPVCVVFGIREVIVIVMRTYLSKNLSPTAFTERDCTKSLQTKLLTWFWSFLNKFLLIGMPPGQIKAENFHLI